MLDIVGYPIAAIPAAESTELVEKIHLCVAGTAAAPAVIATRMGMESTLIGAIGKDDQGDLLLLNIDDGAAAAILRDARKNGATITADLISPVDHTLDSVKAIAPHLDYFMPSIDEALQLSGMATVEAAADFFLGLGVGGCVIKCGGDGAYLATSKGCQEWIPVIRDVQVIDTSGCGDSFCAGFSVGLSHGFSPIEASRFATATAAQVASGVGSDAGVKDFNTTKAIMDAGRLKI